MKNTQKLFCLALLFAAAGLGISSCKTPPVDEMNRAIEAVTRAANDADAVTYAGDTVSRAQDTLNRMQSEADSKRYDSAKTLAGEAISIADKAIADGRAGAARARDEAQNFLSAVGTEITQTGDELEAAKKLTGIKLDSGALDAEFAAAKTIYEDAGESFNAANYRDAISKAQPIRPALANIRVSISDAVLAASKKK